MFGPIPKNTDKIVVLLEDGTYWPAHKTDIVYNDVAQHAGQVLYEPAGSSTGTDRRIITAWVIDAKLHNAVLGAYQEYYKESE
jgi:hypothetical protein